MSNRDLPESTVEWLSLVRYQMMMAAQQASLGRPLYAFALNSAQDAVESALSLVIQAVGGDVKARPDFLQSFDEAIKHGDDPDALKVFRPSLNAMNNARVSFKHHGNTPDEAAVKRHTARAVEFIEALTQQVFGT
ncbi:MAG TPA: hypothetical protein VFH54_15290, partial [Mycobacteriales bacterium]|nr:hypothetical protein [Mycobacteriales bacterium]